jgi:hypothetical protein
MASFFAVMALCWFVLPLAAIEVALDVRCSLSCQTVFCCDSKIGCIKRGRVIDT